MTHWLRQLFRRPPTPAANPPRFRLGVDTLEDRVVPAVTIGGLDPLLNGTGIQTYNLATSNRDDVGNAVAIQSDGKIVVVGSDYWGGTDYDWGIWRYNPDGSLDTTFDGDGFRFENFTPDGGATLDHRARAVAIQSDGKIVVGGYSSTATNGRDMTVIRLNANGSRDTSFDGDGIWTRPTLMSGNDEVSSLAIQSDGNIVLAGYETFSGADTDFRVIRLTPSGAVDSTMNQFVDFALGGGSSDQAAGLAIQPDGKVVLVGSATTTSATNTAFALARFNATGGLDTTFDGDGRLTFNFDPANGDFYDFANAVAIDANGKIVVAGNAAMPTTTGEDFAVARLNSDGTFDTTFDGDGKQTFAILTGGFDGANSVALQPDGKIVLAGITTFSSTDRDIALGRLNANGSLDTTFSGDGKAQFDGATASSEARGSGLALDASGRMVVVGSTSTASNGKDVQIIRVFGADIPLVVNTTADETNGTVTAGNLSLREAIALADSASDADAITFSEGLNGSTITLGGTRLEVRRPVSITGPSTGITLDGNLQSQLFYFDGRTNGTYAASLSNLTVTRGQTGDSEEVIDGYNSGDYGGGILNDQTSLTLTGVTVSSNQTANNAGGIYNWQGANSKLTLNNCLLTGNSAGSSGGAIYNWSNATITGVNTTFSGNTAGSFGGGIFQANGGAITLTNTTATQNKADSDNNASGTGGFLAINSGTVTLHNSIVAGNLRGTSTADEIAGTLASGSSYNLIQNAATAGGLTTGPNGNQVGVDPLLQPLNGNGGLTKTHALGQNSPALGNASASVANYSVYDQRGTARDVGAPDVGAYEVQHPLSTVGAPTTLAALYAPKPSATQNEAFVKGLYQSTLLRAPDAGGLAYWLNQLAGGVQRSTVANGFVNSTENRTNQVTFYYRYFLGRQPDPVGLNGWVAFLQAGADEGQVMTGFILSPEFSGNNTNAQFVNLMYYALLGRAADTVGFNTWMSSLAGGTPRSTVVGFFLRSQEGIDRVVHSMFQTYLKRQADSGALVTFRTQLTDGTSTFGQAANLILGGQEFFNNAGNNMA